MLIRLLFFFYLAFISNAFAEEQITAFHSDIQIQQNGDIHVIETIQVLTENKQIRRGIYRDFPTIYPGQLGTVTRIGFKILSIKRDGQAEPFHQKKIANGVRIYLGDSQVYLKPGSYTYQIEYLTTRQLGFFQDYDELYWNVTGNGWNFPILQATARVSLPQDVDSHSINMTGYTGKQGSNQQFLTHHIEDSNSFVYETTRPLNAKEGLTIVLNWPKDIVAETTPEQKREQFIEDNKSNLIALGGLATLLIYYFLVWLKVGKDPDTGIIMPRYRAPDGFSPASTRFIHKMSYDKTCFTTALVNLTIKGAISIDQDSGGKFVVTRETEHKPRLAAGEAVILQELFTESDQITLTQSEHKRLGKAIRKHEASLRKDYEKLYFLTNKKYFFPGILLSIAVIFYAISNIPNQETIFSTIFVSLFTTIPFFVIGLSFKRMLKRNKTMTLVSLAVQIGFFGVFFFIAGDIISQMLNHLSSVAWPIVISAYLMLGSNLLFEQWLKTPTLAGRKLLDEIEGLRLYLNVAEDDEIQLSGEPTFSSDIYEKFLPFAIALGVDHAWSAKLDQAIATGLVSASYHPHGFHYHNMHHGMIDFSDSLSSSLDSAISSSSTAPGSTSGSSGGSSGGGGGGGGGGGW